MFAIIATAKGQLRSSLVNSIRFQSLN